MTREEAKEVLISTLRDINSDSEDFECTTEQFTEAMFTAIEELSKPSLPSNLDEAAFNYAELCKYEGAAKLLCAEHFKAGAEWMAGRGWISVDERLPEMDEEVIVLSDELGTAPIYKIAFGHIVDVRCIDYNGWNIPGVKYWMPCPEIPNSD